MRRSENLEAIHRRNPRYIYVSVNSADLLSQIQSSNDSYMSYSGFQIRIVELDDLQGLYGLELLPVSENGIYDPIIIRRMGMSKSQVIDDANGWLEFDDSINWRGFDPTRLQFYNETPDYSLSYISRQELYFILENADYAVFSGAIMNTGIPISFAGFVESSRLGAFIQRYFTFKIEGYVPTDSEDCQDGIVCLKPQLVEHEVKLIGEIIREDLECDTLTVDMPVVTSTVPCPPRWFYDTYDS